MQRGGPDDTICAIATPAGEGGIGIVRLSGPQALRIADKIVQLRSGQPLASVASHTLCLADLRFPDMNQTVVSPDPSLPKPRECFDEALVVYMKAPRSFTGEDIVEIQSHGGSLILSLTCRACLERGARLAEPGEFTKRAFLNGRLDLSQAEAVLDTIRAKSAASLTAAQRQLRGDLAREVDTAREALVHLLAQLEAGIDFSDEDVDIIQKQDLLETIDRAAMLVERLRATARTGRLLRDGARVVIAGRPNVGKSSLLNRLLKEERAIVTAVPGTTRDLIEEAIDLGGVLVHLVDTAGIRDTEDPVEHEGIKRSWSAQEQADLRVIVLDGSLPLTADDRRLMDQAAEMRHVIVINKADLPAQVSPTSVNPGSVCIAVSAKTGDGVEDLRLAIRAQLTGSGPETADG
ncbi:MAG TPA: tRNA uridine-5-carboxymethylaminomethyl(34) synthesis GTPase MnmE, partial [Nitrospira sp.]|nr:tRNA uridine-5-carboxymethylaminomethyl(34) synthesis GTPase MnmE [Nitrospira sp.]